jgi:hypothetical protein
MKYLNETEEKLISPFMHYFNFHSKNRVLLEWNDGTKVYTKLDTAGETQNEFGEDEEGFEEYFMCVMETIEIVSMGTAPICDFHTGGLFEVNYHNFPDIVRDSNGTILLEKSRLLAK